MSLVRRKCPVGAFHIHSESVVRKTRLMTAIIPVAKTAGTLPFRGTSVLTLVYTEKGVSPIHHSTAETNVSYVIVLLLYAARLGFSPRSYPVPVVSQ